MIRPMEKWRTKGKASLKRKARYVYAAAAVSGVVDPWIAIVLQLLHR